MTSLILYIIVCHQYCGMETCRYYHRPVLDWLNHIVFFMCIRIQARVFAINYKKMREEKEEKEKEREKEKTEECLPLRGNREAQKEE